MSKGGGHIEVGEVAEAAMIREVREETGVEVAPVRLVAYQRLLLKQDIYTQN